MAVNKNKIKADYSTIECIQGDTLQSVFKKHIFDLNLSAETLLNIGHR